MRPIVTKIISAAVSVSLAVWPIPSLAESAVNWDVPQAFTPQDLPPRLDPDVTKLPDYVALEQRAYDLMDGFATREPILADRVLALNLDAKAAFALVRDTLQSQPYGGRLRSPEQVLLAGGGNPYDKAATLADLLGKMGFDTRLVVGTAMAPVPDDPCTRGDEADAWQLTELGRSVAARVQVRAAASYAGLRPLLAPVAQAAIDTGPHIWLQMREGAAWVDLDPWAPGTAWGAHPMGDGTPLTDLPAAQSVLVTVTVERLRDDGSLQRDDVLSTRLDMPDEAGSLVTLTIAPRLKGIGGTQARIMAELAGGTADLVASLMINDRVEDSAGFAAPGHGAVATGFLAEPGAQITTGVWLTLTSTAPGMADHSEVRTILDLVPPALRGSDVIDPAALIVATPGTYFPMALEGLRQIILSNGGTSRQLVAARTGLEMRGALNVLIRAANGETNPLDMIWASFLEAERVSLAAETLMRSKPARGGACLRIDRPRALVWGVGPGTDGQGLRWLDWMLDDVAVQGGDAVAQAEVRLWHGAVQAALEKEALMSLLLAPADLIALDSGPATHRDAGAEAAADRARGYLTVANAAMDPALWWRIDPATGSADARAPDMGNTAFIRPGSSGVNAASGAGRARDAISTAEQLRLDTILRNSRNGDQFYRALEAEHRANQAARALEREKAAAKEELIMLKLGIGIALTLGAAVGIWVILAHRGGDEP